MRLILVLILMSAVSEAATTAAQAQALKKKAQRLEKTIENEKEAYEERKQLRFNLVEELDKINSTQNQIRHKVQEISQAHEELTMAMENLAVEYENEKERTEQHRVRVLQLMKVANRIKRDGVLRFLIQGKDLRELAGRVRVLFRTLRSHSMLTRKLDERIEYLKECEHRIVVAKNRRAVLLDQMTTQERLLEEYLIQKRELLARITKGQTTYQQLRREYKKVSAQVAKLFRNLESVDPKRSKRRVARLPMILPVEKGQITKRFGRHVHEKFKTVVYQKGIEIKSDQNAPVFAVLPGAVEYQGWVKGLGNVIIIHHGGGLYSLSAHLYMSLQSVGSKVQQGDKIGLVGDTGTSEGPALYFELREKGKAVDPLKYLPSKSLASLG